MTHRTLSQASNTLHPVSRLLVHDTGGGMSPGTVGDHEPAPSSCKSPTATAKPPASGAKSLASASSPMGIGRHQRGTRVPGSRLAFLVFDREIKLLGSRFASPVEVLLVSGESLSAGGHTGFAERNGEQSSAGGRFGSCAAAGHPRQPGFPCLAGSGAGRERGPIPAA